MKKQLNVFLIGGLATSTLLISSSSIKAQASNNQSNKTVYTIYDSSNGIDETSSLGVNSSSTSNTQGYFYKKEVLVGGSQMGTQDDNKTSENTSASKLPPVVDMSNKVQQAPQTPPPSPQVPQRYVGNNPIRKDGTVIITSNPSAASSVAPMPSVNAINTISGTQLYDGRSANTQQYKYVASQANTQSAEAKATVRNRSLDHDLSNRPAGVQVVSEMYTPEYRAMMSGNPNYKQYATADYYTEGAMEFKNGNIQNVGSYTPQPLPGYQNKEYVAPPAPRAEKLVNVDVLRFKNGASLTGKLISMDDDVCRFQLSNGGSVVDYATSDVQTVERY